MENALLEIDYLNPQNPRPIMSEIRRLLERSRLTPREVELLRGVWKKALWAARRD
jgi:tRNA C32,U32 (ribose-2'-O)-methylase TrmJ